MLSVELLRRECGTQVVLGLRGELDAVNASDAVTAITAIMPGGRCVIVDLAELEFADCAALTGLRQVQQLARQGGGDLSLAAPVGLVLRLLTLTEMFAFHASVAAAVAARCEASPWYAAERPAVRSARRGEAAPSGPGRDDCSPGANMT
jgi:anti-anti-sigma factor